jgi:phenylacetate-coenzyme A ligase PaaK-like adenylate-forming protein
VSRPPLPRPGARAYAHLYSDVLWPAWERFARRRATVEYLELLERSQWAAPEDIERQQLASLRALLAHAGANVPYWRETFRRLGFDPRDVRRREDIAALPVLTRDMVRERYTELVDPALAPTNLKKGTSGSTGAPLRFEYSRESECWRQAAKLRGWGWGGYRPGLPTLHYWARLHDLPPGARGLKMRVDRVFKREVYVDSMRQDEEGRRHALTVLRRQRPSVIICFTQSLAQFARWVNDRGLRDWDDIAVLCGAEALLASDRDVLTRAFGPHVFETYGARETMLIATECEAHDGMHLTEENLLVEIGRDGTLVPVGETGDVLVTDLHNYGMPLIRYANGDMGRMAPERRCACGRGLRKLESVDGRRADILTDGEGNPLPGMFIPPFFVDPDAEVARQFQCIQKPGGELVMRIVKGRDWSAERMELKLRQLRPYLRGLTMKLEYVDAILPGPSGKMRFIVVERP